MELTDISRLAAQLDGVSERRPFEFRDLIVRSFPEAFSVPRRFAKHTMVVADLGGNGDAVEDAVIAAWELQSSITLPP